MINKKYLWIVTFVILICLGILLSQRNKLLQKTINIDGGQITTDDGGMEVNPLYPLTIEALKKGKHPGSDIVIEQTLKTGSNYSRYIASYKSEGLKIFGLLTIPNGKSPNASGWPVVIFNHGYISPSLYKTTEKYVAYQDAFARAGYVTFKSDYRGHGNSEGNATGGYGSNAYTIDVLNAISSIKKLKDSSGNLIVDSNKIGMWGHSMGGSITLKAMVSNQDIKAGVIWAGVVGSYEDLLNNWRRRHPSPTGTMPQSRRWRQELVDKFGSPEVNPEFWNSISPTSFVSDISGPLQLHHGTADASVPLEFSQKLESLLKNKEKTVEFYTYEGDDHNLSKNLSLALRRSVDFFDRNLK